MADVHDERLWFGVTRLTGAGGNSSALVGTPNQVADALLAYRRGRSDMIDLLRPAPAPAWPAPRPSCARWAGATRRSPRGGLPATTARRTGDGWALTGRKIFSTGAEGLTWMVVWARTEDEPPRVGGFLVQAGSPGISIERTWDHLGLRASRSDGVIFAGPPVPAEATTGLAEPAPRQGSPVFMAWNALGLSALYLGVADAARDWLLQFLAERTLAARGRPLATLPRFQAAAGEIDAALVSAGTGCTPPRTTPRSAPPAAPPWPPSPASCSPAGMP